MNSRHMTKIMLFQPLPNCYRIDTLVLIKDVDNRGFWPNPNNHGPYRPKNKGLFRMETGPD
jgi:hypothetical protein